MKIASNNRFQGTLHKVSGPLNRDVQRPEMMKKNDELAMATVTARKLEKNPRYAAKYENYR